nr:DUF3168 domain-containing protein [uncultured Roseateles sp.]
MSSHHLIKAALEGDAELVAAVGGRIRVDFARENDAYPFVVYKRSALDREKGLDGKVQAEMETFEIECWADTRDASVGISELAMAALDAADLDPEEAQPDGVDPELLKRATVLSVQVWTER